jgi:Carboxypeptidase regulatory-like domain
MYPLRWLVILGAATLLLPLPPALARHQEPASPAPPPAAAPAQPPATTPANPSTGTSSSKRKYSHANDFLIRGTVFTDKALAFPAVQLRIRRSTEKKFHWETYTNSRGDFAVRVPQGLEYELVIHAKGFADQTRAIDAKNGLSETTVTFRMEPTAGVKK